MPVVGYGYGRGKFWTVFEHEGVEQAFRVRVLSQLGFFVRG